LKGALRIGIVSPGPGDIMMTRWFHLECFTIPKKLLKTGVDARRFVQENLEDKTGDQSLMDIEEKVVEAIMRKPQTLKSEDGSSIPDANTRIKRLKDIWNKIRDESEEPIKKKAKREKIEEATHEKISEKEKLNVDNENDAAVVYGLYEGYNSNELKDVLRWNKQLVSGTKDLLLQRIIDGHISGRLGMCPTCVEGRLKLNDENCMTVLCRGWYDEENMMRNSCSYSCSVKDASRLLPWYTEKPLEEEDKQSNGKKVTSSSTKDLQSKASAIEWDLSKGAGIKAAAKDLLRLCTADDKHKLDITDEAKAKMEIGKILLSNREKNASEIVELLVEKFGFLAKNREAKEEREDNLSSTCKVPANGPLVLQFLELGQFYFKEGNKNAGGTYKKVSNIIQNFTFEVTEENAKGLGKGKTKVAGIGKGSADKMYEYATTGVIAKLEEKKASL